MRRWIVVAKPRDDEGEVVEHRFSAGLMEPWRVGADEVIARLPTLSIEILPDGLGRGGSTAGVGALSLINTDRALDGLLGLAWADAAVEIWEADIPVPTSLDHCTLRAVVRAEQLGQDDRGLISVALKDVSASLDEPLALERYAGTGGLEGPEEYEGRIKPFAIGPQLNVDLEGKWINRAALIAQVHSRAMEGVLDELDNSARNGVQDKGIPLINGGDVADYAALVGLNLATQQWEGKYVTCNAEGLIRLAREPKGVVTVDFAGDAEGGYVELPGEVIQRIIEALYDGAAVPLDSAAIAALDNEFPHAVSLYVDREGPRISDWLETVMVSCGGSFWVDALGKLTARLFGYFAPVDTVNDWECSIPQLVDAWPRWRRLVLGYRVPRRLMSGEELAPPLLQDTPVVSATEPAHRAGRIWIDPVLAEVWISSAIGNLVAEDGRNLIAEDGRNLIYATWRRFADITAAHTSGNTAAVGTEAALTVEEATQRAISGFEASGTLKRQGTETGDFTATLTGFSGTVTGTVEYQRTGRLVVLYIPSLINGTSNSGSMTMTGIPAELVPDTPPQSGFVPLVYDGGNGVGGAFTFQLGVLSFDVLATAVTGDRLGRQAFQSSGLKGLFTGTTIMYFV